MSSWSSATVRGFDWPGTLDGTSSLIESGSPCHCWTCSCRIAASCALLPSLTRAPILERADGHEPACLQAKPTCLPPGPGRVRGPAEPRIVGRGDGSTSAVARHHGRRKAAANGIHRLPERVQLRALAPKG